MPRPLIDLIGKQFGRWSVLERAGRNTSRQIQWRCECECGNTQLVAGTTLRYGTSQGCKNCKSKRQERTAKVAYWNYLKTNAKSRNLPFSLSFEDLFQLLEKQNYKCALSHEAIHVAIGRRRHMHGGTTASVDRIDSTRGYLSDNVWWVHKDINHMKWALPLERFKQLCRAVTEAA